MNSLNNFCLTFDQTFIEKGEIHNWSSLVKYFYTLHSWSITGSFPKFALRSGFRLLQKLNKLHYSEFYHLEKNLLKMQKNFFHFVKIASVKFFNSLKNKKKIWSLTPRSTGPWLENQLVPVSEFNFFLTLGSFGLRLKDLLVSSDPKNIWSLPLGLFDPS